jgi:tetratricopeptide (TPR) repeat protein
MTARISLYAALLSIGIAIALGQTAIAITSVEIANPIDTNASIKNRQNRQSGEVMAVSQNSQPTATNYISSAIEKYKRQDYQGALADINRAIQIDPKNAQAYDVRGVFKASELQDTQGALADYNRSIQLDPNYVGAYINRGNLKDDKLQDTQGALADYNRAIQIEPNANVYYNRSILKYNKLQDFQGALADLNRAIQIEPNFGEAYSSRGLLKYEKLKDRAGAIADMERAAKIYQQQGNTARYRRANELLEQWQSTSQNTGS